MSTVPPATAGSTISVAAGSGAGSLSGRRVLVTQSDAFMGPMLCEVLAPHGIQVNAIAQNFVENPTYFPPEVQADPRFRQRLAREVPLGRLVSAREDAEFVAYLCGDAAACFVGQVFPICGGWVAR